MRDRDWAAVVLALLVVIGGFGLVDDPVVEPNPTPTEDGAVTVVGDELSFDATTVYDRVAELHGTNRSELPGATVNLRERPSSANSYDPSPFERRVGIEPVADDIGPAAFASGQQVVLYTDVVVDPADRQRVLAHEFAHVIQFDRDVPRRINRGISGVGADETLLRTAVIEGAATYVEHRYAVEYLDASPDPPTWAQRRENLSQLGAFVVAHYHFGHRYVAGRVDSVQQLDRVYDEPPRTTEQLLHGYEPHEELPPEMPVTVEGLEDRTGDDDRRTKGELFVRIVLEGQLDPDRAAVAAAGWGNDELVVLDDFGGSNYAWVLGWDTPADADEFEAAVREFLDGHADRQGGPGWRADGVAYDVERAGDRTVVLFVGDEDFVGGASASAEDLEVTVTVDEGTDDDARVIASDVAVPTVATSASIGVAPPTRDDAAGVVDPLASAIP